jgi:hypothetical protein
LRWEGITAAQRHLDTVIDHTSQCVDVAVHLPMVLTELGYFAELRGDPHTAARLHGEAYDLSQKIRALLYTAQTLEGLAGAPAAGSPTAGATVLGAAAAERTAAELPPAPAERDDVVRAITAARATLREAAFAKASEGGGRPTPDEPRAVAEQALPRAGRSHRR